jgi:thioester reductase-like protein
MQISAQFITGFPGFLASELMLRLLAREPESTFICLVQPKFRAQAETKKQEIEKKLHLAHDRIQLVEGDLTESGLGIATTALRELEKTISEVFHFAAVYDLNVEEALAQKVNVEGTRQVLQFLDSLPNLKKFHYVSTCYVSGKYPGVFKESDLERGQVFNNFYESTKYEAEKLVRAKMKAGLPAIIYRPSIVVGNSKTGETQKFDGVYFVMQWLLKQSKNAILPRMSNPENFTINLVPSDYVVEAIVFLCRQNESVGKTFQLADPHPLTIAEVTQVLARACNRQLIEIPVPRALAKFAIGKIPGVEKWVGIPRNALDYFVHPTHYEVSETQRALSKSNLHCPSFRDYAPVLVDFMKNHPSLRTRPMV